MDAEKSYDLPSASRKPKKSDGIIQSESKHLRTRRDCPVNLSPRARGDEMRWDISAPTVRKEKGMKGDEFLLPPVFALFRPSWDRTMLTYVEKSNSLLSPLIHSHLIWICSHKHNQKLCLIWEHCSQSGWCIKLSHINIPFWVLYFQLYI